MSESISSADCLPAEKSRFIRMYTGFCKEMHRNRVLMLMSMPAILFVLLFSYIPMPGIILAFKNYTYTKGIFGSDWIGFSNFRFFFMSGTAFRVTINTLLYNIAFTVIGMILQITVAVLLSEIRGKPFKKLTQSLILLPTFISWVVVGAILWSALNFETGVLNGILVSLGMERVNVMNEAANWPGLLIFFQVWKGFGYGSVVYLAAVTGIDQEIYEAADIDGANIYQRTFHITLPYLRPTAITLLLLGLGNIIRGDFGMFYNLTGDNPLLYEATDIVDTFVFRSLMQNNNIGMSTAAGLYQSVIGFVIIMTVNSVIKKVQPEYALF